MKQEEQSAAPLWKDALSEFDALLQQAPQARQAALDALARSRPLVHEKVLSLLRADDAAESRGLFEPAPAETPLSADAQLGPYRLIRPLGEGGMGQVWLARRNDGLFEGEVAIKTLHPYFAGGSLRQRFLREARFLGSLTHPNIARLLDAGVSASGTVYLVLEYVDGVAIDAWCDERRLRIEQRLDLFVDVCEAIAHAHAHLIVHRDIKPSNILITADGTVKLLDFGIAKLIEHEQSEATELTRMSGRMFTPEYAAPEQILGKAITTATDVYSLGVLLYVLLTGLRPYRTAEAEAASLEQAVLHQEPEKPSRAVAQANVPMAAARRSTDATRLSRRLRGDLDNIVARALAKDADQRYESVLALAADIRRHRRSEPVLARAPRLGYRARKFVDRHRWGVAAGCTVALAIAASIAGIAWQARIAREQARLATLEAGKATAVKDFLVDVFAANRMNHPDGASARKATAEQLLAAGSEKILTSLEDQPDVRAEILGMLGGLNFQLEKYPETEALQRERVRVLSETYGPNDARIAEPLVDLGVFLRQRGEYANAREHVSRALSILDSSGDTSSSLRGRAEAQLGQIAYMVGTPKDPTAVNHYRAAVAILEKLPPDGHLINATTGLARAYEQMGNYEGAIEANRRAIELATKVSGPRAIAVGGGHQQLARALARTHRLE